MVVIDGDSNNIDVLVVVSVSVALSLE